jgi:SseB protein N-terminal domain
VAGRTLAGAAYPGDDGSPDPQVSAALDAYAAGRGSEYAALTALAGCRLLVPVVAVLTEAEQGGPRGLRRDKSSEMALPTLIGADGRAALPAFTCMDSLARWRPDARPVPVAAAQVWQTGAHEASAVVVDVAGPVPFAVDGARLAALAEGRPAPVPHEDPDVVALVRALAAAEPAIAGFGLQSGRHGTDLTVCLVPGPSVTQAQMREAVERVSAGVMAGADGRVRRGIEVALTEAALIESGAPQTAARQAGTPGTGTPGAGTDGAI